MIADADVSGDYRLPGSAGPGPGACVTLGRAPDRLGSVVIVVCAALKGGVGKTTTSVYLSALAAESGRPVTLIDGDPQASAAEWVEEATDDVLGKVDVVEAPTERLLGKALDRLGPDAVAVVDMRPGDQPGAGQVVRTRRRRGGADARRGRGDPQCHRRARPRARRAAGRGRDLRRPHVHPRLPRGAGVVGGRGGPGVGHRARTGGDRGRARRLAGARRARRLPGRVAPVPSAPGGPARGDAAGGRVARVSGTPAPPRRGSGRAPRSSGRPSRA